MISIPMSNGVYLLHGTGKVTVSVSWPDDDLHVQVYFEDWSGEVVDRFLILSESVRPSLRPTKEFKERVTERIARLLSWELYSYTIGTPTKPFDSYAREVIEEALPDPDSDHCPL